MKKILFVVVALLIIFCLVYVCKDSHGISVTPNVVGSASTDSVRIRFGTIDTSHYPVVTNADSLIILVYPPDNAAPESTADGGTGVFNPTTGFYKYHRRGSNATPDLGIYDVCVKAWYGGALRGIGTCGYKVTDLLDGDSIIIDQSTRIAVGDTIGRNAAVAGDPMTLQNDSLNTLMTDVDAIKTKTDLLTYTTASIGNDTTVQRKYKDIVSGTGVDNDVDLEIRSIVVESDVGTGVTFKSTANGATNTGFKVEATGTSSPGAWFESTGGYGLIAHSGASDGLRASGASYGLYCTGGAGNDIYGNRIGNSIGNRTGSITGNLSGSVGSVTGKVTVVDTTAGDVSYIANTQLVAITGNVVDSASNSVSEFKSDLANAVDGHYSNALIIFTSGTNAGQPPRMITDYVGDSKYIKVSPAFEVEPTAEDDFQILYLLGREMGIKKILE